MKRCWELFSFLVVLAPPPLKWLRTGWQLYYIMCVWIATMGRGQRLDAWSSRSVVTRDCANDQLWSELYAHMTNSNPPPRPHPPSTPPQFPSVSFIHGSVCTYTSYIELCDVTFRYRRLLRLYSYYKLIRTNLMIYGVRFVCANEIHIRRYWRKSLHFSFIVVGDITFRVSGGASHVPAVAPI